MKKDKKAEASPAEYSLEQLAAKAIDEVEKYEAKLRSLSMMDAFREEAKPVNQGMEKLCRKVNKAKLKALENSTRVAEEFSKMMTAKMIAAISKKK